MADVKEAMGGELILVCKPAFGRDRILQALASDQPLSDRRLGKAWFIVRAGSRWAG